VKRPNPILFGTLGFLLKGYAYFKGQRITRKVKLTEPSIVLSNHTSFHDFVYTTAAIYPKRVNYLAADKMFYDPLLGFFLRLARAIPKCLFQSDLKATMAALGIIKQGGILSVFPEGQISPIGVSLPYNPAIAKLVKKAKVPLYVIRHQGAYLVNPPWSKKTFKGKIETVIDLIATKEEVQSLSEQALLDKITDALSFNTHVYASKNQIQVKLKDIDNLESVIYRCPSCGNNHLESQKTKLVCPDCHSEFLYGSSGKIGGFQIDELYHDQEHEIQNQMDTDSNFHLSSPVRLETYRGNRVVDVGEGVLILDKSGYHFSGSVDNQPTIYEFKPDHIPTLPSDLGRNVQIYEGYTLFQFVMEDRRLPTQFVIAGEYLHQISIKNQKSSL